MGELFLLVGLCGVYHNLLCYTTLLVITRLVFTNFSCASANVS